MTDPFVARFSESGVAQWAVTASGTGADYMKDIDADATGAGVWVLTQMYYVAGTSITVGSSSFASMSPYSSIAFHVDSSGTITNAAMIHGSSDGVLPNVYSIVGVSDGYYLGGNKCCVIGTLTLGSQTLTSPGAYVAHYSTSTNDFDGLKVIPGTDNPELGNLVRGTGSDVLVMAKFPVPASNHFLYGNVYSGTLISFANQLVVLKLAAPPSPSPPPSPCSPREEEEEDVCSKANEGSSCGCANSGKTCQCTSRGAARNLLFASGPAPHVCICAA